MALIKCPECEGQLSDKATTCPHCGYSQTTKKPIPKPLPPIKKESKQYGCGTIILLLVVVAIFYSLFDTSERTKPVASKPPTQAPKLSAAETELQKQRKEFIDKGIREGIFYKIEIPGDLPHLWVTPRFLNGDFDTKSALASAVLAYYITENPKYDLLIIKDSRSGKRIGSFSSNGLDLD